MKFVDIKHSVNVTISTGAFENLKEYFEIGGTLEEGDDPETAMATLEQFNHSRMKLAVNKAKTELIDKQYDGIRFYEKDGKRYPSVTSILGWDQDWRISEDELSQYGARGTLCHKIIEIYLKDGVWVKPEDIPELKSEYAIMAGGSLGLSMDSLSYKKFFEENKDDIDVDFLEQEVINTEVGYGGRIDILGQYKGRRAVLDVKTGNTASFQQLAAYGVCCDAEVMVLCHVGSTQNKSGFIKPKISEDIDGEFKKFVVARKRFRLRFGC